MYLISKHHGILYWEYLPPLRFFSRAKLSLTENSTVQLNSTAWCSDLYISSISNFSDSAPPQISHSLNTQNECMIGWQPYGPSFLLFCSLSFPYSVFMVQTWKNYILLIITFLSPGGGSHDCN